MKYAVETWMLSGWENCWSVDGVPSLFDSKEDAEINIQAHIKDCIEAVEGGDMQDSPDRSEFRIVEVRG